MKLTLCAILCLFCIQQIFSQNISGKWYGKITQSPGGYKQLYDLELTFRQSRRFLYGDSYSTIKDSLYVKIGFTGNIDTDSIRLSEHENNVMQEIVPFPWEICIKNYTLAYFKEDVTEYLEGSWNGKGRDNDPCVPGRIILARSPEALENYLKANKDSVINVPDQITSTFSIPDLSSGFRDTAPRKIREITLRNKDIQIRLNDYSKIDNDTVSVYLNRVPIAKSLGISKRPAIVNFKLDTRLPNHELLLYAENLGNIPPNTSSLLLIDGPRTHHIRIESDKQKTAAIYLHYKP